MKIVVVGLGYVGLSVSVLLSQHHEVVGLDIVKERIALINDRKSPIVDAEISRFMSEKKLNLTATDNYEEALHNAEIVIIAVPTNFNEMTNSFDVSIVEGAVKRVLEIVPSATIVIKSTIPVGLTEELCRRFGVDNILFSPEFLREGHALADNLSPSRIIVGALDGKGSQRAKQFADLMTKEAQNDPPVLITRPTEAEAIKLFANAYLALRVSYFNELDTFAEKKGLSAQDIIQGVSYDARIGNYYNNPSFGYGGYCLPKDTKQLLSNFTNVPQNLFSAIVESNTTRIEYIASQIEERVKSCVDNISDATIGVYRLAMKSGSDNWRECSILKVVKILRDKGYRILIYEPTAPEHPTMDYVFCQDLPAFLEKSTVIIANRQSEEILPVKEKVYTRDAFSRD